MTAAIAVLICFGVYALGYRFYARFLANREIEALLIGRDLEDRDVEGRTQQREGGNSDVSSGPGPQAVAGAVTDAATLQNRTGTSPLPHPLLGLEYVW